MHIVVKNATAYPIDATMMATRARTHEVNPVHAYNVLARRPRVQIFLLTYTYVYT